VDYYWIPFGDLARSRGRLVYEFDAADVGRSYIYPALARGLREAGMQLAAHFAYDPTYMAYANTEYHTHYMNLVYTPRKALSMMISSQVFRRIPMYSSFGRYPDNNEFGDFRVSYPEDLAEMSTNEVFIYSNHTETRPPEPAELVQVAGYGNSPVVQYEGRGAYFIDRIGMGIWRLEVMPDAIWVKDVFGKTSLKEEVAVLNRRRWPMEIDLPDLGKGFTITPLNEGNRYAPQVADQSFDILPGTYLLVRNGIDPDVDGDDAWKHFRLNEYAAPASLPEKCYVIHEPAAEITPDHSYHVSATIATAEEPETVEITLLGWPERKLEMVKKENYHYEAVIPAGELKEGFLKYVISVREDGIWTTFPSRSEGNPSDWDYLDRERFEVRIVERGSRVFLFNAIDDAEFLVKGWGSDSELVPSDDPTNAEYRLRLNELPEVSSAFDEREKVYDYSELFWFGAKVRGREEDLESASAMVLDGRSLTGGECTIQLAMVMQDGMAYGALVTIPPEKGEYKLDLNQLKPVPLPTLPRPWPDFMTYFMKRSSDTEFDLSKVESLLFSIGPGIPPEKAGENYGIAIESVWLE
jgi:hypothetical protein